MNIAQLSKRVQENIQRVMIGQSSTIELLMTALVAGGHVLLEDVPGTGKTVLAKSLARSLDCDYSRIQFTPDLLPNDITGASVYSMQTGEFTFRRGPVFTHILLADEINRATPRTQAAMLECMQERQVTEGGVTHALERPFLVLATQNPVEIQGTFPLPEAQLDRFLMRLTPGYPSSEDALAKRYYLKSAIPSFKHLFHLHWGVRTRVLRLEDSDDKRARDNHPKAADGRGELHKHQQQNRYGRGNHQGVLQPAGDQTQAR